MCLSLSVLSFEARMKNADRTNKIHVQSSRSRDAAISGKSCRGLIFKIAARKQSSHHEYGQEQGETADLNWTVKNFSHPKSVTCSPVPELRLCHSHCC